MTTDRIADTEPGVLALPRSALGRFRLINALEGTSYILLLGVAMPLKYLAHEPAAVRILGTIHGLLFILFVASLMHCAARRDLTLRQSALAMFASLIPFGAFVFDRKLRVTSSAPGRDAR